MLRYLTKGVQKVNVPELEERIPLQQAATFHCVFHPGLYRTSCGLSEAARRNTINILRAAVRIVQRNVAQAQRVDHAKMQEVR